MKKHSIEPHHQNQNGAERMVQVVKQRASYLMELYNSPRSYWSYALLLTVINFNRTSNQQLDWKTPFEAQFGETPDTSCLRFKFYQPIRIYNPFSKFPHDRWQKGRYLGVAEDVGDDITYIVEVEKEGKKSILARSIV